MWFISRLRMLSLFLSASSAPTNPPLLAMPRTQWQLKNTRAFPLYIHIVVPPSPCQAEPPPARPHCHSPPCQAEPPPCTSTLSPSPCVRQSRSVRTTVCLYCNVSPTRQQAYCINRKDSCYFETWFNDWVGLNLTKLQKKVIPNPASFNAHR